MASYTMFQQCFLGFKKILIISKTVTSRQLDTSQVSSTPVVENKSGYQRKCQHTHTYTHPFHGPLTGTTWVSRYQKGKTNLDFTEARDSEWQWHQLGHMQVCTSLQTDNHASTPLLSFLQAGCPSCRPTNIVKALKAIQYSTIQKCQQ